MKKKFTKKKKKEVSEVKKKLNDEKSFIHIKLERSEALNNKQNLLSLEKNLLKIFQRVENYKKLRVEELNKKRLILRKFGEVKKGFSKLQTILPNLKIPKILKNEMEGIKKEEIVLKKHKSKGNIEQQLLEIQEKLNNLQH